MLLEMKNMLFVNVSALRGVVEHNVSFQIDIQNGRFDLCVTISQVEKVRKTIRESMCATEMKSLFVQQSV